MGDSLVGAVTALTTIPTDSTAPAISLKPGAAVGWP